MVQQKIWYSYALCPKKKIIFYWKKILKDSQIFLCVFPQLLSYPWNTATVPCSAISLKSRKLRGTIIYYSIICSIENLGTFLAQGNSSAILRQIGNYMTSRVLWPTATTTCDDLLPQKVRLAPPLIWWRYMWRIPRSHKICSYDALSSLSATWMLPDHAKYQHSMLLIFLNKLIIFIKSVFFFI